MKKAALVVLAIVALSLAAMAQNPTSATVTISATKGESLSLTVPSSLAAFTLNAAGTDSVETRTLNIGTTWNVKPTRGTVTVCAGADNLIGDTASGNTDVILASAVQGSVSGGAFSSINNTTGCGQTAVTVVKTFNLATEGKNVTTPKASSVDIKLSGVSSSIQADTYTGTITVYASAQ